MYMVLGYTWLWLIDAVHVVWWGGAVIQLDVMESACIFFLVGMELEKVRLGNGLGHYKTNDP